MTSSRFNQSLFAAVKRLTGRWIATPFWNARFSLGIWIGGFTCAERDYFAPDERNVDPVEEEYFCGSAYCDDPACVGVHWGEPSVSTGSATTRCVDPIADARKVLQLVKIENPSARPDTEDAANRVALALRYLDMATA